MQKLEFNEIPFPIIKLLCDKSLDKRSMGHRELENLMRQVINFNDESSITNFIKVYISQLFDQSSMTSYNAALRKAAIGGFILISNILKSQEILEVSPLYLIIQLLISSFKDSDPKIIVESANTMIKILKNHNKLVLKFFNDIFEGLLNLNVNPDQEVRNCGNSLDELLKEIMNNSLQTIELINVKDFNVQDLFNKLFEKIRANHPSIKILIVSWITFLDTIPEIKLINFLPELLPGLFSMLCDKTKDVNQSADKCLKHILKEIESQFDSLSNYSFEVIIKILEIILEQCKSSQEQGRVTAFEWLYVFLQKFYAMVSNVYNKNFKIQTSYYTKLRSSHGLKSNDTKIGLNNKFSLYEEPMSFSSKITGEFRLNHSIESPMIINKEESLEIDKRQFSFSNTNYQNQSPKIFFNLTHKILDVILLNVNSQNEHILLLANNCNTSLIKMIDFVSLEANSLNVKNFEEVLKNYFDSKKESTIDLILNWISKLFRKFHDEMFTKVDIFIENFTNILSDSNEHIFNTILDILCEISKFKEEYTEVILCKLLEKLCANKNLLNSKGLIILKKLSSVLPVTRVYIQFADVLIKMKDVEFIANMLNILDIFLLTYKETEPMRLLLRKLKKQPNINSNKVEQKEIKELFEKIFTAWSFNPISTLVLCIISEYFELSYFLILKFADLKLEQEYFIQLSQLVQLIESSLFNNIRVLLLEPVKNLYLVKTLYGILMLLPQGKAYQALSKRLKSVEILLQIDSDISCKNYPEEINNEEIQYFLKIFCDTHILMKNK